MKTLIALCLLVAVTNAGYLGGAGRGGYGLHDNVGIVNAGARHTDYGHTYAPEFFTTQIYGPRANARAHGAGSKHATGTFTREGQAAGADYETDEAAAAETAARARGYEYYYR